MYYIYNISYFRYTHTNLYVQVYVFVCFHAHTAESVTLHASFDAFTYISIFMHSDLCHCSYMQNFGKGDVKPSAKIGSCLVG